MQSDRSRFELVTRRAFMRRSLGAGLVVTGVIGLEACGGDDSKKLATDTTAARPEASTAATPSSSTATSAAGAATTVAAGTAAPTVPSGPPLSATAELKIDFTYAVDATAGGRGPARNPYIAVWIENAAGEMVQTVSLWLQQGKGTRYWQHLTRWYRQEAERAATGGKETVDTITGATRPAGAYTVAWDGTDYTGTKVGQGSYYVCIEAAREHGPYELIREQVELAAAPLQQTFAAQGELTKAAVDFVA